MAWKEAVNVFNFIKIWDMFIAVILAAAGGLADLLRRKDKERPTLWKLLSCLFVSAFCGVLAFFISGEFNFSGNMTGIVCGVAGCLGTVFIDAVTKATGGKTGLDLNENKKDGE